MPTFIETCCCRGSRPAQVVGSRHVLRSEITGTLLRDRHVARFLVAPAGYGKSSCAYEYAQVVFGFQGVFWIRCDSPCFLRDLDDGTLAPQIRAADRNGRLLVLDDVPHLDAERTDAFDAFLDAMLGEGYEVLVCCIPSVDTFSSRQRDRIVVDGRGLLLTDDEIEVERLRGALSAAEASSMAEAGRAPCMVWGEAGAGRILRGLAAEELPGELELLLFCMLSLADGPLADLAPFSGEARLDEDAAYLASMYPFLGIDGDAGAFRAIDVPVADVLSQARLSPAALARASAQGARDGFCDALAQALLDAGRGVRAAEFVAAFAAKGHAADWTAAHGWELLGQGLALPVAKLTTDVPSKDARRTAALMAERSWALAMMGDASGAARARRRVLKSTAAPWQDVAAACLSGNLTPSAVSGDETLAGLEQAALLRKSSPTSGQEAGEAPSGGGRTGASAEAAGARRAAVFDWDALLRLERARLEGGGFPAAFAHEAARKGGATFRERRNSLLASGAWFLSGCAAKAAAAPDGAGAAGLLDDAAPVAAWLSGELKGGPGGKAMTWPECAAADAVQEAVEKWPFALDAPVAPKAVSAAREAALSLLVQAEELRRGGAERSEAKGDYQLTHEDAFRADAQPASRVAALRVATPTLMLSLFGGFEAWVGSDKGEPRQLRRRNGKIALALLAMNRGREVTKEKLAAAIWPDADAAAGRQNLYVVWAYLKKVLKVGPSCPYLVSTQTGYKLDGRYVASDVEEFEELCKGLLFGRADKSVWEELYAKVGTDFSEDLLPEVTGNPVIDAMRLRFRTQLVDGLVEASVRLAREGEMRGAIWFSREALRRDRSREDAYISLMEAQIASNQRGAALDTYFECRRFLSEQLGIDPSRRVVELYRSVIETEEEF